MSFWSFSPGMKLLSSSSVVCNFPGLPGDALSKTKSIEGILILMSKVVASRTGLNVMIATLNAPHVLSLTLLFHPDFCFRPLLACSSSKGRLAGEEAAFELSR